jgi:hypothetical protein
MAKARPSKSLGSKSRGGTSGNRKGGGTSRQKARGGGQRGGKETSASKATGTRGKKGSGSSGGGSGRASTRNAPRSTTRTSRKSQSRGRVSPGGAAMEGDEATRSAGSGRDADAAQSGGPTFGPREGKGMQGWQPGRGKSKPPASRTGR